MKTEPNEGQQNTTEHNRTQCTVAIGRKESTDFLDLLSTSESKTPNMFVIHHLERLDTRPFSKLECGRSHASSGFTWRWASQPVFHSRSQEACVGES